MATNTKYGPVAMTFHWLSAALILGLLGLGWVMGDLTPGSALQFQMYQLHKSLGVTIFVVTGLRLAWRLIHGVPPLPATMPRWEQKAARLGHLGLYFLAFGLPLIGWAVVSTSKFNIPTLLFGVIPLPHLAFLAGSPDKAQLAKLFEALHGLGANALAALLVVHVGAALRHHIVLKDDVLRRMVPFLTLAVLVFSAPAQATDWSVDQAASRLGFTGSQSGTAFSGTFQRWNATIAFDPAHPQTGQAHVTVDLASAKTGDSEKDVAMPGADWFDVKSHPEAVFDATAFRATSSTGFEAVGTLSIRGVSRPVTLPFTLDLTGKTAHAVGKLIILRTDWGVGQGQWASGQTVALDVAITLDVTAKIKE